MRKLLIVLVALGMVAIPLTTSARTWYIKSDGTGDAPTIQAGVDSSEVGDIVLVAAGTYYENVSSTVQDLTLISESGPDVTVIDGAGVGRCVYVEDCSLVEGFTLRNGDASLGGGVMLWGRGELVGLIVLQNSAAEGGGVWIGSKLGRPNEIRDCLVYGNTASDCGGGIFASSPGDFSDILIGNCTIDDNGAPEGGNVYAVAWVGGWAWIDVHNCIITSSEQGEGVFLVDPGLAAGIECNSVWNNAGGNYGGVYPYDDPTGTRGNISVDPLFCDPQMGDYTLQSGSPCLPSNHPDGYDCGLIGAYGHGCTPTAIDPPTRTTWGAIKATFR